jgi:hypothetical protein
MKRKRFNQQQMMIAAAFGIIAGIAAQLYGNVAARLGVRA